ncbi:MAG: hypothetical protein WEB78_05165 [Ilumatobacteraceae bacterium]
MPQAAPGATAAQRPKRRRRSLLRHLRDSTHGRGWRAKLFGPTTDYGHHRIKFKDMATGDWVDRVVPRGADPDEHFDRLEAQPCECAQGDEGDGCRQAEHRGEGDRLDSSEGCTAEQRECAGDRHHDRRTHSPGRPCARCRAKHGTFCTGRDALSGAK